MADSQPPSPSHNSPPVQEVPQGAPSEGADGPSLAPEGNYEDQGLDDGLESAFRQLQEEQAGQKEGAGDGDAARGAAAAPGAPKRPAAAPSDADGEAEGEDGTAADAPATRKPPEPKASQWASLNRREQEFAKRQREFSTQKAELEAATAALRKGKTDTWGALRALGFEDKEEFLKHIAKTGGEASPEQQKIAELEAWKERQEASLAEAQKKQKEDAQAAEYRQQVDVYKQGIAQYVKQSEKWKDSVVALDGNESAVFQVMQDHYLKEGEELSYDEAVGQVNERMESELSVALKAIAGTARGKAIIEGLAAKSLPDANKRGKSTPRSSGISTNAVSRSEARAPEALSLDEAVAQNAEWLNSQMGGLRR